MSEQEFEDYLILLSRFLGLSPEQRESIAAELRDHMHQRLDVLQRLGVSRKEAVREALAEFGDASRLAAELSHLANRKQQKRRWVMRLTAGSLAAVATIVLVTMAIWPDPVPGPMIADARAQAAGPDPKNAAGTAETPRHTSLEVSAHERIRAALRKKGQLDFKDVTLNEMVESLEGQLGIQIEVDHRALDDIQIDPASQTVVLSEPPMSYGAALRHILRSLDLTTVVTHGVLMITSKVQAESLCVNRLYPVWDLARVPGNTKNGDGCDYDSLIDVITATIAPDSWDEVGGPGTLASHKGLLLISQTEDVQLQVEAFLKALREFPRLEESAATPDSGMGNRERIVDVADNHTSRLIGERLEKEISADFLDAPLDDVVDYIQQAIQLPVIIDRRALEDKGLDSSTVEHSFSLQRVSLRSALRLILSPLDLVSTPRDEALVITTQEEAEHISRTRLYYAADLIDIVDAADYEQIKVELEALADVFETIVEPDSWSELGGLGVLGVYASRGVLVCTNTTEVHEQMESLLGEMAHARRSPQAAPRKQAHYDPAEIIVETYQLNPRFVASSEVVEVITALVAPTSWQPSTVSPTRPYLKLFSGSLIVRQRRDVQREIQRLLRRLGVVGPQFSTGPGAADEGGMF